MEFGHCPLELWKFESLGGWAIRGSRYCPPPLPRQEEAVGAQRGWGSAPFRQKASAPSETLSNRLCSEIPGSGVGTCRPPRGHGLSPTRAALPGSRNRCSAVFAPGCARERAGTAMSRGPGASSATLRSPRVPSATLGSPRAPSGTHGCPLSGSFLAPSARGTTPHVCTRGEHPGTGTGWGGRGCRGPWGGTGRRDRFYWQSAGHGVGGGRRRSSLPGQGLQSAGRGWGWELGGAKFRGKFSGTVTEGDGNGEGASGGPVLSGLGAAQRPFPAQRRVRSARVLPGAPRG